MRKAMEEKPFWQIKSRFGFISFLSALCVVDLMFPQTSANEGRHYECDLLPLMEVGSVAHKYYLLNIRLPVDERKKINVGIGEIKDIQVVVSKPHHDELALNTSFCHCLRILAQLVVGGGGKTLNWLCTTFA